jgi:hypothetical protein
MVPWCHGGALSSVVLAAKACSRTWAVHTHTPSPPPPLSPLRLHRLACRSRRARSCLSRVRWSTGAAGCRVRARRWAARRACCASSRGRARASSWRFCSARRSEFAKRHGHGEGGAGAANSRFLQQSGAVLRCCSRAALLQSCCAAAAEGGRRGGSRGGAGVGAAAGAGAGGPGLGRVRARAARAAGGGAGGRGRAGGGGAACAVAPGGTGLGRWWRAMCGRGAHPRLRRRLRSRSSAILIECSRTTKNKKPPATCRRGDARAVPVFRPGSG